MPRSGQTDGAAGEPLFAGAEQPARRRFGISSVQCGDARVPVVERDIAAAPFWTLVEFRRQDLRTLPTLLVVPPLSGHFAILLRDLVLGLLPDFRVVVLDWTNVRHVPLAEGPFGFDDNILTIRDAIRHLGPGLSVVALCQGCVPALAATALLAGDGAPAALALIAAPVDPLASPTRVVRLLRERPLYWYRAFALRRVSLRFEGHGRWVYAAETQLAALQAYFAARVEGEGELARKARRDDGADPERFPFLDLYSAIMDIDGRHFVENIERVFHRRALARGTLSCAGTPVDPAAIRDTALLVLEGEEDDIAAPGQGRAALSLCTGLPDRRKEAVVVPGCGHFSLFHGGICRAEVLPRLRAHCLPPGGGA